MPLTWNTSLETGIRDIDLQHQELLEITNELERHVSMNDPEGAWEEVLPHLSSYALFHFANEENLLIGLPAIAKEFSAHIAEHRAFAVKVEQLRTASPNLARLEQFLIYLQKWLLAHISGSDKALIAAVREAQRAYQG